MRQCASCRRSRFWRHLGRLQPFGAAPAIDTTTPPSIAPIRWGVPRAWPNKGRASRRCRSYSLNERGHGATATAASKHSQLSAASEVQPEAIGVAGGTSRAVRRPPAASSRDVGCGRLSGCAAARAVAAAEENNPQDHVRFEGVHDDILRSDYETLQTGRSANFLRNTLSAPGSRPGCCSARPSGCQTAVVMSPAGLKAALQQLRYVGMIDRLGLSTTGLGLSTTRLGLRLSTRISTTRPDYRLSTRTIDYRLDYRYRLQTSTTGLSWRIANGSRRAAWRAGGSTPARLAA